MIHTTFGNSLSSTLANRAKQNQGPSFAGKKSNMAVATLAALAAVANGAPIQKGDSLSLRGHDTASANTNMPLVPAISVGNFQADSFQFSPSYTNEAVTVVEPKHVLQKREASGEGKTPLCPPKGLSDRQAQTILKNLPFTPSDINLFRSQTFPGAAVYQPAAAPAKALTPDQWKGIIKDQMAQVYLAMNPKMKISAAKKQAEDAANLIDDAKIQKHVPDLRMRAAVAMLKGTAADGAIKAIQNGTFSTIDFGTDNIMTSNSSTAAIADSTAMTDGSQRILVNSRYQHEDPRAIASALSHEVSHQDGENSQAEEQTNYAVESLTYGQYVLADANLPLQKTELTQRRNLELLARMNDRDPNTGNLRLLSAHGSNLYPGGDFTLDTFADAVKVEDPSVVQSTSPGNEYIRGAVKQITGVDLGNKFNYNQTLAALDQKQNLFSLPQLVQINKNLKLNVPNA